MSSSPKPLEPLLSPTQVSVYTGVPTSTLAVWRCTGRFALPFFKVGRAVRYRREDVEAFLASGGKTSKSAEGASPGYEGIGFRQTGSCHRCGSKEDPSTLRLHKVSAGKLLLCPNCHNLEHQIDAFLKARASAQSPLESSHSPRKAADVAQLSRGESGEGAARRRRA